jgi:hypothetical protein
MHRVRKKDELHKVEVSLPPVLSIGLKRSLILLCYLTLLSSRRALYHDYASSGLYKRPTLVVAFNSGLHRHTTKWLPTVQFLLATNTPCVFTSYDSDQAKLDAKHLGHLGANMIWMEEWNKWTGERVESQLEDDPCQFENAFWLGFQGARNG